MREKISNTLGLFLFLILLSTHTQGMEIPNMGDDLPPLVSLDLSDDEHTLFTQDNASIDPQDPTNPKKGQNADSSSDAPLTLSDEVRFKTKEIHDSNINIDDSPPQRRLSKKPSEQHAPASPLKSTSPAKKSHERFSLSKGEPQQLFYCKSYRIAQVRAEPILYEHALDDDLNLQDPQLTQYKQSRAYREAQANHAYDSTHRDNPFKKPFSAQPTNEKHANKVGYEVVWRNDKHKQELKEYKHASDQLLAVKSTYEGSERLTKEQADELEKKLTTVNENFIAIQKRYMQNHMPLQAIETGVESITPAQLVEIERSVFCRTSIKEVITRRPIMLLSLSASSANKPAGATGTPYYTTPIKRDKKNIVKVKGFLLEGLDAEIAYNMLPGLLSRLERETNILKDVQLYYNRTILPRFKGWNLQSIANWATDNDIVSNGKQTLKKEIELKFPPILVGKHERNLSTDQGIVLALLNKDPRGISVMKNIVSKIKKFKELNEDETFEYEMIAALEKREPMTIDRLYRDLPKLGVACDSLSNKPFYAYYMGIDIWEERDVIDTGTPRNYDGVNHVKIFPASPKISFLDRKKLQWENPETNEIETFKVPQDAQMMMSIASCQLMHHHRKMWLPVLEKLYCRFASEEKRRQLREKGLDLSLPSLKNNPIVITERFEKLCSTNMSTDTLHFLDTYESGIMTQSEHEHKSKIETKSIKYQAMLEEYEILLNENMNIRTSLLKQYDTLAWIPIGDTFAHQDRCPESPPISHVIDLSKLKLEDKELNIERCISQKYIPLLSLYKGVNLSHNLLTGTESYRFSQELVKLTINNNNLRSLDFINHLFALVELNAGHNELYDLSPIKTCRELQILDLSNNKISFIQQLENLNKVKYVNLSNNNITCIFTSESKGFKNLISLKINHNKLNGIMGAIFPVMNELSTLEAIGNEKLKLSNAKDSVKYDAWTFKKAYPKLLSLKIDQGEFPFNEEPPSR